MYNFRFILFCAVSVLSICQTVYSRKNERIVGGAVARAGQFPFVAAIFTTTADGVYFCGGAIYNNDFVLTAGQCVYGAISFTIHLGSNNLQEDDPNRLTLATETYFLHPEYNPATLENDIALIKFRSYIRWTDYIRAFSYLSTTLIPDYSIVVTMGWGQTSDETAGPIEQLNYIYLTTISNNECRITFGSQITDHMVCIAGNFNEGTCLGDSGSPLIQYTASGNTYHVGIASFVSGNGCESPDPSGFTRTSQYVDWIRNTTLNN